MIVQVVISVAIFVAAAAGALWVWARHRVIGGAPDWLDEQRKFTRRLGVEDQVRVTVDSSVMPHAVVEEAAGAHGFEVRGWTPDPRQGTTYELVRVRPYPAHCATRQWRGQVPRW